MWGGRGIRSTGARGLQSSGEHCPCQEACRTRRPHVSTGTLLASTVWLPSGCRVAAEWLARQVRDQAGRCCGVGWGFRCTRSVASPQAALALERAVQAPASSTDNPVGQRQPHYGLKSTSHVSQGLHSSADQPPSVRSMRLVHALQCGGRAQSHGDSQSSSGSTGTPCGRRTAGRGCANAAVIEPGTSWLSFSRAHRMCGFAMVKTANCCPVHSLWTAQAPAAPARRAGETL